MRVAPTIFLVAVVVALAACHDHAPPPAPADAPRPHRVIEKPVGEVHAMPPFAIHTDGVGPYRLDVPLCTVLYDLPLRVTNLDVPGLVHLSVVRAENDQILVGGEPLASTSFVSIVGPDVARTDGGVEVGSTAAELVRVLGKPRPPGDRLMDPRMLTFAALPNARFLVDDGKVVAIVVLLGAPGADAAAAPSAPGCTTTAPPATGSAGSAGSAASGADAAATLTALGISDPRASVAASCLTSSGDEVVVSGDEVVVASRDLAHRLAAASIPGLVFAAPVRGDLHDELVAVRVQPGTDHRQWLLSSWRLDAGHLLRVYEEPLYDVSSVNADWLGAQLDDLDLVLDIDVRVDTMIASGVLLDRSGAKIHDAVPLSPVTIARRRHVVPTTATVDGGLPPAPLDAGTPDAAHAASSHGDHPP